MVDSADRIKLIDFGIAMKEDARRITHVNVTPMLGTPDYIAPEQVKGQRGDQRSDIYSLGIMLYEMLTGEAPFSGPNPLAVMNERVLHDPSRRGSCGRRFRPNCRRFSTVPWSATRAAATRPPVKWLWNWSTRSGLLLKTERGDRRCGHVSRWINARQCSTRAGAVAGVDLWLMVAMAGR